MAPNILTRTLCSARVVTPIAFGMIEGETIDSASINTKHAFILFSKRFSRTWMHLAKSGVPNIISMFNHLKEACALFHLSFLLLFVQFMSKWPVLERTWLASSGNKKSTSCLAVKHGMPQNRRICLGWEFNAWFLRNKASHGLAKCHPCCCCIEAFFLQEPSFKKFTLNVDI